MINILKQKCKVQTAASRNSTLSLKENYALYTNLIDNFKKEFVSDNSDISLLKKLLELENEPSLHHDWRHLLMLGEGGIGKTAMMLKCCKELILKYKIAIYIPLRGLHEGDSLQQYIFDSVLGKDPYAQDILDEEKKQNPPGEKIYLFIDGFNELSESVRTEFVSEIIEWASYDAIQIIISSRRTLESDKCYEFTAQRVSMQRLDWEKVQKYLKEEGLEIPDRKMMNEILGLPLMLKLYTAIQKDQMEYDVKIRAVEYLDWRNNMMSTADMLWNYIQCQIYNAISNIPEPNNHYIIAFVLAAEYLAPFLASKMNAQKSRYLAEEARVISWIEEGLSFLKDENSIENFPRLRRLKDMYQVEWKECFFNAYKFLEFLKKKLSLIQENDKRQISFEHQEFQDVLHLVYIENAQKYPEHPIYFGAFTEVALPVDVLNVIGENFTENQVEILWEAMKKETGNFGVRNAVEIWKRYRKYDLSAIDFSGCDLTNTSLSDVILSDEKKHAKFLKAKISRHVFWTDGHEAPITAVSWSPSGGRFISGSYDSSLRIWNADGGDCIRELIGHTHYVRCLGWSPKEDLIASGSDDRTIRVWDISSGKSNDMEEICTILKGHTGWIYCVSWSCDGKMLASGDTDSKIFVWSQIRLKDNQGPYKVKVLEKHTGKIRAIVWSPTEKAIFASGSSDMTVRIWNADTGASKILKGFENGIVSMAWSSDGRILAVTDAVKIYLWEIQEILKSGNKRVWKWGEKENGCISCLRGAGNAISSIIWIDGGIAGAEGKNLRIWDLNDVIKERVKKFNGEIISSELCQTDINYAGGALTCLSWSLHERSIVSGSDDSTLRIWKPRNPIWNSRWLCTGFFAGGAFSVRSVAWSPDGKKLAAGYDDNLIRIWDMELKRCCKILKGHTKRVKCVTWSLDGSLLFSGSNDHSVRMWKLETGECKVSFVHQGAVNCVLFLPDKKALASASDDGRICIWKYDINETKSMEGHMDSVYSLSLSPDGHTMVSGSDDKTLRFWDMEKEIEIGDKIISSTEQYGHKYPIRCVMWSPIKEKNMVISGSNDNTLKRWDPVRSKPWPETPTLTGHKDFVYCVAWSPCGKYIVSGSTDKTLWVWDALTGEKKILLDRHTGYIWGVAWSPDGKWISSASSDGTICIWDCEEIQKNKVPHLISLYSLPGQNVINCDFTGADFTSEDIKNRLLMNGAKIG